ncbi:MAG: hypothetical protein AB1546_06425 [bacterium]
MIRIKFKTRDDVVSGYYELAVTDIVRALPGNVFEISERGKSILDKANIMYEIIKSDEVSIDETEAIRNPLTSGI